MEPSQSGRRALLVLALLAPSPGWAGDWTLAPTPGFHTADARFQIGLTGFVQGDLRAFPDWDPQALGPSLEDGAEIQRARLGLAARWSRLSFSTTYDLLNEDERPRNLTLGIELGHGVAVRVGYFKLPVSIGHLTPISRLDFMERTRLAALLGPGRDVGGVVEGRMRQRLAYQAGVFAGDGRTRPTRALTTLAGRLVFSARENLDLGLGFSRGEVRADRDNRGHPAADGVPIPKGLQGRTPLAFVFLPAALVSGSRVRGELEITWLRGPASWKAELMRTSEARSGLGPAGADLPGLTGTGWSVSATRLLTGEKKARTIVPRRLVSQGGKGALEVGLRLEGISLPARSGEKILTAGLSWWPSRSVRVMTNAVFEHFDEPASAPVRGRDGLYSSLLARLQLHLP